MMEFDGTRYRVLTDEAEIQEYVLAVCEKEWSLEDFDGYGKDLYGQTWRLNKTKVADILPQKELLESERFIADVTPRIAKQRELYRNGVAIPPLILRGKDYFIFDGYARWHMFKELGVDRCLAYTSGV